MCCIMLNCIVLDYIVCILLCCVVLYCIALNFIVRILYMYCVVLYCIALYCTCIALHYITLHYITLHCIALLYISLYCIVSIITELFKERLKYDDEYSWHYNYALKTCEIKLVNSNRLWTLYLIFLWNSVILQKSFVYILLTIIWGIMHRFYTGELTCISNSFIITWYCNGNTSLPRNGNWWFSYVTIIVQFNLQMMF